LIGLQYGNRFNLGDRALTAEIPIIMGIVNVTPDSFSDGGEFFDADLAIRHGIQLAAEGANILDIGGESTRPGAVSPDTDEELRRVIPVISALSELENISVSIDTSNPKVMTAAVAAGASMINDVRALQNRGALQAAKDCDVPVCLMHMQGQPQTMQNTPFYENVVAEICVFLQQRINACIVAGIKRENIILDPGFGFGKNLAHNLTVLKKISTFKDLGYPVLAGLSRKSMIVKLLGYEPDSRLTSSIILALRAAENGASIIRVHDVKETIEGFMLSQSIS
jgi:dihydropteroate synthase